MKQIRGSAVFDRLYDTFRRENEQFLKYLDRVHLKINSRRASGLRYLFQIRQTEIEKKDTENAVRNIIEDSGRVGGGVLKKVTQQAL